ncbi:hypothetical protein [Thermoanaerobacterium sp. R66]|uniref:hypothetical protein n=1 Tax=Thermoanaerobacterium sp. R66 TaxID=2742479 RepID=UPI0023809EF9|nr:hypothetical protein [Thermoanaerobacterium sp. R66]
MMEFMNQIIKKADEMGFRKDVIELVKELKVHGAKQFTILIYMLLLMAEGKY